MPIEASIRDAVTECLSRTGGTLDALFNNGAYAIPGPVEDVPRDALRAIFETNLFGYHDLTRQVIPVMRRAGPRADRQLLFGAWACRLSLARCL